MHARSLYHSALLIQKKCGGTAGEARGTSENAAAARAWRHGGGRSGSGPARSPTVRSAATRGSTSRREGDPPMRGSVRRSRSHSSHPGSDPGTHITDPNTPRHGAALPVNSIVADPTRRAWRRAGRSSSMMRNEVSGVDAVNSERRAAAGEEPGRGVRHWNLRFSAGPLKRLRKTPYWWHRRQSPEITGGSIEFSTPPNPAKSENDVFVVLGGLQENGSPL